MKNVLAAEITRKQFLQYLLATLLSVFGLSGLLMQLFTGHHPGTLLDGMGGDQPRGFGSSKFGV